MEIKPYFKLGNIALAKGDYAAAASFFKEALSRYDQPILQSQLKENLELVEKKLKLQQYPSLTVDVIIPIFNALDDVKKCLESVNKSREKFPVHIVLVNDGSDEETSVFLREFVQKNSFADLIEHEVNRGYTKAVNSGLRFSNSQYLITLNSDTIVPRDWILRLLECINSDPRLGIVGPLSNAASWQNFPLLLDESGKFAINSLPEYYNLETFQKFLDKYSTKKFPEVPFVNGFCFMIKRKVIDTIGYMDEEAFPVGYGEENDFCLRALKSNFKLAVADNTYVYHSKSKSFGHKNRQILSKKGGETLKAKHGEHFFKEKVDEIKKNKILHSLRTSLNENLCNMYNFSSNFSSKQQIKIGYLLPVGGGGGGANSVIQETSEMVRMGYDVQVYVKESTLERLLSIYSDIPNIKQILRPYNKKDVEHWTTSAWPDRNKNIHYLVRDRNILVATVFTTVSLLKNIIKYNKRILPAYYSQDYEPLFFDHNINPAEYNEASASYTLIPNNLVFAKTNWIINEIKSHHNVIVEKVKPSIDELLYCHNESPLAHSFQILAMVRPATPRRGAGNTMKLLKKLKQIHSSAININIFGCENSDEQFLAFERDFEYTNHGILTRKQVADLAVQSHLFIDLSSYQAFGRTGLESMAAGCVSILPKLGGADEYIIDGINSFQLDYPDDENKIIKTINRLVTDRSYFEKIKGQALATASEYSVRNSAMSQLALFAKYLRSHAIKIHLKNTKTVYYCHEKDGTPAGSAFLRFLPLFLESNALEDVFNFNNISHSIDLSAREVIFQRFYDEIDISDLRKIITKHQQSGAKIYYDIDENLFDTSYLIAAGFSADKADFVTGQVDLLASRADKIITTTPHLANLISSKYNTPVFVQENIICQQLWGAPFFTNSSSQPSSQNIPKVTSQSRPEKFVFGYYGSQSNENEISSFCNLLAKSQIISDLEFQCIGAFQDKKVSKLAFVKRIGLPKDNRYPKFVNWIKQITKDWSLGIIYSEENKLSLCKSNIKFLEYAMLGLPIIVSNHPIYQSIAKHRKNCLVVNNITEEWIEAIQLLQNNPELRARLASQAYKDVSSKFLYASCKNKSYYEF